MRRRQYLSMVAIAGTGALPGCGFLGDNTYDGAASDYLLTTEEIGSPWSLDTERVLNLQPAGLESGRGIDLSNGEAELSVAVAVLETPADAEEILSDRRTTLRSQGVEPADLDVGGDASVATTGSYTHIISREANVYVEVYGNLALTEARRIAEQQYEKIRDA